MGYYKTPMRVMTGYCVIEVMLRDNFTAYIKSCTAQSVRYAYTKLSAKPFDDYEQASRYIEKNKLLRWFPNGCKVLTIPAADSRKIA